MSFRLQAYQAIRAIIMLHTEYAIIFTRNEVDFGMSLILAQIREIVVIQEILDHPPLFQKITLDLLVLAQQAI
jgi:hypothetical protein|tara:strand:- start:4096 stop:4314 length:219 start_codon:yes stop_codon:yes gene_type:complete